MLGPPAAVWLQRKFFAHERYLYYNHALSPHLRLGLSAALLTACALTYLGGWHFRAQLWPAVFPPLREWPFVWLLLSVLFWHLLAQSACQFWPSKPPSQAENQALSLDSVQFKLRGRALLKGLWLKLHRGELLSLLGRNGCGKSSLLKILLGEWQADFASLQYDGKTLKSGLRSYLEPGLIGYLPQENFLPPELRVRQALKLFCGPHAAQVEEHPTLMLLLESRIRSLSGGERRLLELAAVLALPRAFYLLDEPFSELAPLHKQELNRWLQAKTQQAGILLTDQDFTQLQSLSSSWYLLQSGSLHQVSDPEQLQGLYLPEKHSQF